MGFLLRAIIADTDIRLVEGNDEGPVLRLRFGDTRIEARQVNPFAIAWFLLRILVELSGKCTFKSNFNEKPFCYHVARDLKVNPPYDQKADGNQYTLDIISERSTTSPRERVEASEHGCKSIHFYLGHEESGIHVRQLWTSPGQFQPCIVS